MDDRVFFKMPFHPCPSGCGRFLSADDGHNRCLQCLGFQRAEDESVDDSCTCCGRMSMTSLFPLSHLSFTFTFTFMHLADAFIQSDSGYTFFDYLCYLGNEPTTFCAANAMLYH